MEGRKVNKVTIVINGYAYQDDSEAYYASGTVTHIETHNGKNIVVDTGGVLDGKKIKKYFQSRGMHTSDVDIVVCTHTHSDHIANLNLFANSLQYVMREPSVGDRYNDPILKDSDKFQLIGDEVEIWSTPGHCTDDISIIIFNAYLDGLGYGTVACCGDIFEKENDDEIWNKSSINEKQQLLSRQKLLEGADFIIPGHGVPFRITKRTNN